MQTNRWTTTAKNMNQQDNFSASKQDCHLKTEKVYDDWEACLRTLMLNKTCDVHEETLKTAKLFTQIDSLSKNTKNSLEKTGKVLDQLLDKKMGILATTKSLYDIQSLLDLKTITKNYWQLTIPPPPPSPPETQDQSDDGQEEEQPASL